jgi:large subunit ribosomal protein L19
MIKNGENILPVKAWMFLEVHERLSEWEWNRIWKFKGLVISVKKPNHPDGTFTIRWPVARMTIEKIYPLSFKKFDKVLLVDDYKIKRSKLYYIREKVWKDARFKSKIKSENKDMDLVKKAKKESA